MCPVVHFEMPYENSDRVAKFYSTVFGWQMQKFGEEMGNYVLATTATQDAKPNVPRGAINGGFFPKKEDWPAQYPSVVIAIDDIQQMMKKINDNGEQMLGAPMRLPNLGL